MPHTPYSWHSAIIGVYISSSHWHTESLSHAGWLCRYAHSCFDRHTLRQLRVFLLTVRQFCHRSSRVDLTKGLDDQSAR
ncbi:hypothetical protein JAAARDRAFT_66497 [Jaapia argillacea MUCL 33604]|uniref:Uncharacterized protein n=1 Tax=Jaapia argillacea MUCL 33604 TaxID=933084 RepID=A0A067Q301_9AGAM|nr:hypothetical protein JAAARDRAFT_66497 [Jaapia argillacea MUCL 33604]